MTSFVNYAVDPLGQPRFYGVYRGIVVDAQDPLQTRRLRLSIPALFGDSPTEWAEAVLPPIIDSDLALNVENNFALPSEGDGVWVMFEAGIPDFPVWIGIR